MTDSPSLQGMFLIHFAPRQVSDCPEGQGCPVGPFAQCWCSGSICYGRLRHSQCLLRANRGSCSLQELAPGLLPMTQEGVELLLPVPW